MHLRETAWLSLAKGATIKIFIFHTFVCKNESNFAEKFRDIFNSSPHSKSICRSTNLTKNPRCSLNLKKNLNSKVYYETWLIFPYITQHFCSGFQHFSRQGQGLTTELTLQAAWHSENEGVYSLRFLFFSIRFIWSKRKPYYNRVIATQRNYT